jgi:hypothetical protein
MIDYGYKNRMYEFSAPHVLFTTSKSAGKKHEKTPKNPHGFFSSSRF